MEITLSNEWMGNPKGSKLDLLDNIAQNLIARGIATDKKLIPEKDLLLTPEDLKKIHKNNKMNKGSKDKMIREAKNKGI